MVANLTMTIKLTAKILSIQTKKNQTVTDKKSVSPQSKRTATKVKLATPGMEH